MKIRQSFAIAISALISCLPVVIGAFGRNGRQRDMAWLYYHLIGAEPEAQPFFWRIEIAVLIFFAIIILRVLLWNMVVDEDEFVVRLGFLPIKRINFADIEGITMTEARVAVYKKGKRMPFAAFFGGKKFGAFVVWMRYRGFSPHEPADFKLLRQMRD